MQQGGGEEDACEMEVLLRVILAVANAKLIPHLYC